MKHKPQICFGAINLNDSRPWVAAWTIKGTAKLVREEVGRTWYEEDARVGWAGARTEGMRVVKIEVRIIP